MRRLASLIFKEVDSRRNPRLVALALAFTFIAQLGRACFAQKEKATRYADGFRLVALPVQFSNLFLDDLKRLANLAA